MSKQYMRGLPVLALALASTACGGGALGGLGDILTGGGGGAAPQGGTMRVEVQQVQQQEIIVRTQDGQQGGILWDSNTQVVYQNRQYPVTALERGDIVEMRVQEVQQGLYTDLIQVVTSVQERSGATGGTASNVVGVEGEIGQVDLQRWAFTLQMTQGGTITVHLPSNASSYMRDRLRQYRAGDYVRVSVRPIDQQSAQLVNWDWQ